MDTKNAVVIFEDLPIRKIEKDGQTWISAIDVAKALKYKNPSLSVKNTIERNIERFDTYIRHIQSANTNLNSIFLNLKGVIAFCMLSKQKKAIPFQRWADSVLEKEMMNIPDNIKIVSKKKRIEFTDTLKAHGYKNPNEYIKTTVDMKKELGIKKKKSECDLIEIMKIATAEMLAKTNIMISEQNGFENVNPICKNSSKAISENTKKEIK